MEYIERYMHARELIENGNYNLAEISAKLEIPIDALRRLQQSIIREKGITNTGTNQRRAYTPRKTKHKRKKSPMHLDELRNKYIELYNGINTSAKGLSNSDTIPDNEKVATVIQKIDEISAKKSDNKNKVVNQIISEIKTIAKEEMSVEQAEHLLNVLMSCQLSINTYNALSSAERIRKFRSDCSLLNYYRRTVFHILIDSIKRKYTKINDIDKLKALKRKLSCELAKKDYLLVTTLQDDIDRRIVKLRNEKKSQELNGNNTDNMTTILTNLVSGNKIDINAIKAAVDNEVEKRVNQQTGLNSTERTKNVRQVFIEVTKAIIDQANEYPIKYPDKVMEALEQTFHMGFESNIRAVIHNYIERGEFEAASYHCDRYASNSDSAETIRSLKSEITRAEIGQIILKGMQADASPEAQNKFYDVLKIRLKQLRIGYNLIPLGKTKDGTRKITLADICEDERDICR